MRDPRVNNPHFSPELYRKIAADAAPRVKTAEIGDGPRARVVVTTDDGERHDLFAFYPDEIGFTERELVGLTVAEVWALRRRKDVAYLQS